MSDKIKISELDKYKTKIDTIEGKMAFLDRLEKLPIGSKMAINKK